MSKIHIVTISDGDIDTRVVHGEEPKYHVKMYIEYKTNPDRASYYCELRICERPYDVPSEIEEIKEEFANRFGNVYDSLDTEMNFTLSEIVDLIEEIESRLCTESYPLDSRELKIVTVGGDYPSVKVDYVLYE